MVLGSVLAGIAWAADPAGGRGALAAAGERLGDVEVVGVETHPEYERYTLRRPGGGAATVAELTTGAGGLCDVDGLTIFPREDLSGAAGTAGMDALCARLAERRPSLRARIGPDGAKGGRAGERGAASAGTPKRPGDGPAARADADAGGDTARSPGRSAVTGPRVETPIRLVALGLFALVVWRARPDRLVVAVAALAFAVRAAVAPRGVHNGALAGYEKLVLARGSIAGSPYGDGWGALMGSAPGWPDGVLWANGVLAAISAGLVAWVGRCVAGPTAGLFAGLAMAILPTHVGVSLTETMHVSVLALQLAAAVAAVGWMRRGAIADGLVAAIAAGLAAHVRPDAIPFALGLLAVGAVGASGLSGAWGGGAAPPRNAPPDASVGGRAARGSRALAVALPLGLGLGLLAWCAAGIGGSSGGLLQLPDGSVLLPRFGQPEKERAFQLFLHAGFTPPVLWGLAAAGAAALWRAGRRRALALVVAWIAVTTLPLSAKAWPLVDAIRLQLAGQAPWLLLAGAGAASLPRWAGAMALLAFLPYFPLRPWVQTEEWAFLRATVPTLPAGTTVRYDPRPQRAETFAAVMEHLGPATWSAEAGELVYVGLDCRARGGCDTSGCVASRVTRLQGRVDLDLRLEDRTIGFWDCSGRDGATPAP